MKKVLKGLPIFIVGLIVQATPAHADGGSFFDSIKQAYHQASSQASTLAQQASVLAHQASDAIKTQINAMYGTDGSDGSGLNPQDPSVAAAPPASSPDPASSPSPTPSYLSQCRQYLGNIYDPSWQTDPQKKATVVLNGVLDFALADLDKKLSDNEIAARNHCVELTLDAGADANSNGEYNDKDGMLKDVPVPLARAVVDNDEPAVKALLDHKANPSVGDSTLGRPIPVLQSAIYYASQDIAADLINAGADLSIPDLLWMAAGNADDKVVDLLLQSKKIPVNQIDKFSDIDDGETALDISEQGVSALKGYQNKFPAGSTASVQDKLEAINRILYYSYPNKPQLKFPAAGAQPAVDPDTIANDLLTRQQNVSNLLKAAGWTCKKEGCGIIDLNASDDDSDSQN